MDGIAHVLHDSISLCGENSIRAFDVGSKIHVDVQQYRIAAVAGARGSSLGETHTFQVASLSRSCVHVVSISCVSAFFISWAAMQAQKHVSINQPFIVLTETKFNDYFIHNFEHGQ
jgi:hypothetical protein